MQTAEETIERVTPMYQEYTDTAAALIDTCKMDDVTRDVAVVQEKLDLTKHRWTKIKELADERKQQMQEAQKLTKKFQSIISSYEETLRNCEKHSKKPKELGSEPETLQNYLGKLQVIISVLHMRIFYFSFVYCPLDLSVQTNPLENSPFAQHK